ncbi:response regulator [Alkalihalobacillus sp. MEB130]|uniref:response regulator n=1 Tax=Alkalihalobacillus sp. MEB130 TaxID=2976704 RepID=UPI0028DFABCC|nr:response regulator [Alkalihalobacillus sp. MEB130]MDT8862440.1 response regulator [Alkalihalobacillus sp. MEB130]
MQQLFRVLIIEDDFRVADITTQFVGKVDGFAVVGSVKTGEEAKRWLQTEKLPDLILLDVYIPDVEGLELFWTIRRDYQSIDVIMMTAAKEVTTIEEALRAGIFDYIVKPVDFSRFEQTLTRYVDFRRFLSSRDELEQEEIDRLTGSVTAPKEEVVESGDLPKGIDRITLEKIKKIMEQNRGKGWTAVQVGKEIGASRSTARRYLEYLVSSKAVEAEQKYGDVGRPERRYSLL